MSLLFPRHGGDHADMDMASTTLAAAAAAPGGHGHDSMGPTTMQMIFQTNMETALYANSWTPRNPGAYAATCIFLMALAVVARLLLAAKSIQEARWLDRDANRRYVASNGRMQLAEYITRDPDAKQMTLSENGVEESVVVVGRKGAVAPPWRFSVDPVRALMDTVLAGVGYLL